MIYITVDSWCTTSKVENVSKPCVCVCVYVLYLIELYKHEGFINLKFVNFWSCHCLPYLVYAFLFVVTVDYLTFHSYTLLSIYFTLDIPCDTICSLYSLQFILQHWTLAFNFECSSYMIVVYHSILNGLLIPK